MVFAAACVLVSAALHALAGGGVVPPHTLAAAMALAWIAAYLAGGRQRGMSTLLGACFAAQYGMHHLFAAGAGVAAPQVAGHDHGGGLGMLLVHAAAAAGSAWWLERGDSALATMLRLAVTSLGRLWTGLLILAGALVDAGFPGRAPVSHGAERRRVVLFAAVVSRRGPPVPLSVR